MNSNSTAPRSSSTSGVTVELRRRCRRDRSSAEAQRVSESDRRAYYASARCRGAQQGGNNYVYYDGTRGVNNSSAFVVDSADAYSGSASYLAVQGHQQQRSLPGAQNTNSDAQGSFPSTSGETYTNKNVVGHNYNTSLGREDHHIPGENIHRQQDAIVSPTTQYYNAAKMVLQRGKMVLSQGPSPLVGKNSARKHSSRGQSSSPPGGGSSRNNYGSSRAGTSAHNNHNVNNNPGRFHHQGPRYDIQKIDVQNAFAVSYLLYAEKGLPLSGKIMILRTMEDFFWQYWKSWFIHIVLGVVLFIASYWWFGPVTAIFVVIIFVLNLYWERILRPVFVFYAELSLLWCCLMGGFSLLVPQMVANARLNIATSSTPPGSSSGSSITSSVSSSGELQGVWNQSWTTRVVVRPLAYLYESHWDAVGGLLVLLWVCCVLVKNRSVYICLRDKEAAITKDVDLVWREALADAAEAMAAVAAERRDVEPVLTTTTILAVTDRGGETPTPEGAVGVEEFGGAVGGGHSGAGESTAALSSAGTAESAGLQQAAAGLQEKGYATNLAPGDQKTPVSGNFDPAGPVSGSGTPSATPEKKGSATSSGPSPAPATPPPGKAKANASPRACQENVSSENIAKKKSTAAGEKTTTTLSSSEIVQSEVDSIQSEENRNQNSLALTMKKPLSPPHDRRSPLPRGSPGSAAPLVPSPFGVTFYLDRVTRVISHCRAHLESLFLHPYLHELGPVRLPKPVEPVVINFDGRDLSDMTRIKKRLSHLDEKVFVGSYWVEYIGIN